jgi:uncharacterized membrane protein YcfT
MTAFDARQATAPSRPRIQWVNAAKGIAIVLVVLHHASQELRLLGMEGPGWEQLDYALRTLRMPLFFLASGLFAARALKLPWAVLLKTKVSLFLYCYALWGLIYTLVLGGLRAERENEPFSAAAAAVLRDVLTAETGLWYLLALAIFFLAIRLLRGIPVYAQVAAATLLSGLVGASVLSTGLLGYDMMLQHFVFFLVACHFSVRIQETVPRLRRAVVLVPLALAYAAATALVILGNLETVPLMFLLLSLIGLPVGLGLALIASEAKPTRGWLPGLGSKTLPIYLLHVPVIGLLIVPLHKAEAVPEVIALALPPLLSAAAVLISLLLGKYLARFRWLFATPWSAVRESSK